MTREEVASYLNITPGTLASLTRANKIPGAIKKGFVSFYRESYLVAWIEGRPLPVDPPPPPPPPVRETDLRVLKAAQEAVAAEGHRFISLLLHASFRARVADLPDEVVDRSLKTLHENGYIIAAIKENQVVAFSITELGLNARC